MKSGKGRTKRKKSTYWSSKEGRTAKALIVFGIVVALFSAALVVFLTGETGLGNSIKQEWYDIVSAGQNSDRFVRNKSKNAVCIDPGHGFDDAGAVSSVMEADGSALYERDINQDIAVRVKNLLEKKGVQVLLTYDSSTKPDYETESIRKYSLDARVNKANDSDVDLFVSIHCDSTEEITQSAEGTRVYYYDSLFDGKGDASRSLSESIMKRIKSVIPAQRVEIVKKDVFSAFEVIRDVNMPSVLVEIGFLSNKSDVRKIQDLNWRNQIAQGIAQGIIAQLK